MINTSFDLAFGERLKLFLNNTIGSPSTSKVEIEKVGGVYHLTGKELDFWVPLAKRWNEYKRGFERRLVHLARKYGYVRAFQINAGDRVIDIGANVGEFSLLAASKGAEVVAFEPNPAVFECLSRNVSRQDKISARQTLLWREQAELTFYTAPGTADSSIIRPLEAISGKTTMEAFPLDEIVEPLNWDHIDLIKCDAEGAEPEVLTGASEVLKRTKCITIDTGPERAGQETGEDCERILKSLGFEVSHPAIMQRKLTVGRRAE